MSAKEVRFADEARHKMLAGVNILANAVKVTLPWPRKSSWPTSSKTWAPRW